MPVQRKAVNLGPQTTGMAQGFNEAAAGGGGIQSGAHTDISSMTGIKMPSVGSMAKQVVHGLGQGVHFIMSYNPYKNSIVHKNEPPR
jgi:hypothetical protein